MARQLRIDYPGAAYHVYSRGNQKQAIFLSDDDRHYFLKVLGDAHERFRVVFQAYCLMPNHYHLIVKALLGGFSKAMHLINTAYTVHLNKKHSRCGHLFQGRFKSILVEADTYAFELSRYIHLNPVRAGIARLPEDFPWSSYREYLGLDRPHTWLDMSLVFGSKWNHHEESRSAYARFVLAGMGCDPPAGYQESKRSGILGSPDFIGLIKARFLEKQLEKPDRERPQLRALRTRTDIADVAVLSEMVLGPNNRLTKSSAIYVSHRYADYTLGELSAFFHMSVSGISSACRRIEKELEHNGSLFRGIQEIISLLREKSDGETPTFLSESNKK
jgi:putative transposase